MPVKKPNSLTNTKDSICSVVNKGNHDDSTAKLPEAATRAPPMRPYCSPPCGHPCWALVSTKAARACIGRMGGDEQEGSLNQQAGEALGQV